MNLPDLPHLLLSQSEGVLTITLNRPERLNAVNESLHHGLVQALDYASTAPDLRLVVITGAGRAFSAGGDMAAEAMTVEDFAHESRWSRQIVQKILDCDRPVLARVNGDAVGFGATLALLCDVVIAVEGARFGDPHVKMGLVAGDGGALVWPGHAGLMAAKYYLLTGDLLPAAEAKAMGLITFCEAKADFDAKVAKVSAKLLAGAPLAMRWTKRALNAAMLTAMPNVLEQGLAYEGVTMLSQDHQEAKAAFAEKRKPQFRGR